MKKVFFVSWLIGTLLFTSCQPNVKEILQKSYEKCQSVENGHYEMTRFVKQMNQKDTSVSSYNCYFRKLPNDSTYSFVFRYKNSPEGKYSGVVVYTRDGIGTLYKKDSSDKKMSNSKWDKNIKYFSLYSPFYTPFTDKNSFPLPIDSTFHGGNKNIFQIVGTENIDGLSCYHIVMKKNPKNESNGRMKTIRTEYNYWINKKDYIPIQYSIAYEMVMNNDTIYQYEKQAIKKYGLNNPKNNDQLKLSSIPSYAELKAIKPAPKMLSNNTPAPVWSLKSVEGKTVNLSDFKGKLVLIDFFYKSCLPCIQALPFLQELNEKYSGKGLHIIGIDPYDTKENIVGLLSNRGITYTVLLKGKSVAQEYHVSGYPTMYLINKKGKVITSQVGYGKELEEKLEGIIKKNL